MLDFLRLVAPAVLGFVAATTLPPSPSAAQATTIELQRAERLAEDATDRDLARSLAAILELGSAQRMLAVDDLRALWDDLRADAGTAEARALATWFALRAARATGATADADELAADLGFVSAWTIAGPVANDGNLAWDAPSGPELQAFDPAVPIDGRHGPTPWVTTLRDSGAGHLNLADFVAPSDASVSWMVSDLTLPRALDGHLNISADGAYRVWVDGMPLAEMPDDLGGGLLRDRVPVSLAAGTHQITIKVASDEGPVGMHVRLTDRRGAAATFTALPGTTVTPPLTQPQAWGRVETLAERLEPLLLDQRSSDRTLAAAALTLYVLQAEDPSEPWRPFRDAVAERTDPVVLRLLSYSADSPWEAASLLQSAVALGADRMAQAELATSRTLELGASPADAARSLAEPLAFRSTTATEVMARLQLDAGLAHVWAATVDEAVERWPSVPAIAALAVSVARDFNRHDAIVGATERAWSMARTRVPETVAYAEALRLAGREGEAQQVIDLLLALLPTSLDARTEASATLARMGDLPAALAILDGAVAQAPGNADLWMARAELRLRAGDADGAAADLQEAILRRPQFEDARTLLAQLGTVAADPWARWRLTTEALLAAAATVVPSANAPYSTLARQRVVRVHDNGLATTWVQEAVMVHTRDGADQARSLAVGYAPDSEVVEMLGAALVGPTGETRSIFSESDYGPDPGPAAMYFDAHTRVFTFPGLQEGDVLIYEYTIADTSFSNIFDDYFGDVWVFQDDQATSYARYGLDAPVARQFYTNQGQWPWGSWSVSEADGRRVLVFEATAVPGVVDERGAPGWAERYAHVSVSTYADWDTLGAWYWHLIEDQLVTTPEIQATVAELTAGLQTDAEKVAAIYAYVVRNTRYVGLEFGVHGFRPYRTSEIFERRFGDCKDTASLINVMLEAAGIEAHIVLVRTRDLGRIAETPASLAVFNHAIAYVPALDLYLDGTAGFSGSSELPDMDQGASAAIIVDGQGARFVTIPYSDASANLSAVDAEIDLSGANATGTHTQRMTGAFAPSARRNWESVDQRQERIAQNESAQIPGIRVTSADFVGVDDVNVPVTIAWTSEGGQWWVGAEQRGLRGFPGRSALAGRYAAASTRSADVEVWVPFTLAESYRYRLPGGCAAVLAAEPWADGSWNVDLQEPWGRFVATRTIDGDALVSRFELRMEATRVTADQYPAFRQWLESVDAKLNEVISVPCAVEEP